MGVINKAFSQLNLLAASRKQKAHFAKQAKSRSNNSPSKPLDRFYFEKTAKRANHRAAESLASALWQKKYQETCRHNGRNFQQTSRGGYA
ncbi:hypothetical protein K0M31_016685 [Melipona bicolor]|uniref:Uncharacterized protein n=1 Tax=Melipona bicolor TaxID=60889 RepID=A0AA40FEG4_9HYME|nr:hypothetical protein K0M31_016685 [Melipona bicolor]